MTSLKGSESRLKNSTKNVVLRIQKNSFLQKLKNVLPKELMHMSKAKADAFLFSLVRMTSQISTMMS